jgi:tetratricopeptide (TPR) repeat protein
VIWILLALVIAASAGVRVLYFLELPGQPDFEHPLVDHLYHDYWAKLIAFGEARLPAGLQDPMIEGTSFFRPPGYPYFLAAVYAVFGDGPYAPRVVQMILGLLTCITGFFFARRWFGDVVALLFAALLGLSWNLLYYESKLNAPVLLVLLGVVLIYVLSLQVTRLHKGWACVAGIVLGVFALVRPNVLTFALAVPFWLWWVGRRQGAAKKVPLTTLCFLAGAVLAIAPATVHNYRVSGEPVLISANGGINFFFGNNAVANGVVASHPDVGAWSCFDYPRIVRDLEAEQGASLTYGEASSHFVGRGLSFIRQEPLKALGLTGRKLLMFWSPHEIVTHGDVMYEREGSGVLSLLPLAFAWAFGLGLIGLALFVGNFGKGVPTGSERKQQKAVVVLIVLFVAVYSATLMLFIVSGRYRVPLIPFLFLGTAYAVIDIGRMAVRRDWDEFGIWLCITAVVVFIIAANPLGYRPGAAAGRLHDALAYEHAGQWDRAIEELKAAVGERPESAEYRFRLAHALSREDQLAEAVLHYRKALELDPSYIAARVGYGKALMRRGDRLDAIRQFREALKISPNYDAALVCYGTAMAVQGDAERAREHYRKAIEVNPRQAEARVCLATLLLAEGNTEPAEQLLREAVKLDPDDPAAHLGLGRIREEEGDAQEAAFHYREALRLDAACTPAMHGLQRLANPGAGKPAAPGPWR